MPTLYLTEDYSFVRRENQECLLVQIPERKGKNGAAPSPARKERVPLLKVDEVVVLGDVTLTASAIHALLEREIEITFLSHHGQFKGRVSPPLSKNEVLRMAQYRAHQEMRSRGELARQFVVGKLSNQRQRLQRMQRTRKEAEIQRSINQLAEILATLEQLPMQQTSARRVLASGEQGIEGTVLGTILGLEGAGSAAYFRCFQAFLVQQQQWPFPGRVKRPATDPVNALLSFGYALLTSKMAHAVQMVGFDHYIGYLHSTIAGRPALALDLMEEFRPLIVDSVVIELLNHRVLTPADFVEKVGAYQLKPEKRTIFFTKFEERLNEEIQHPLFGYRTSYRRCLELQARLLAKTVTGEIDTYPPFLIR